MSEGDIAPQEEPGKEWTSPWTQPITGLPKFESQKFLDATAFALGQLEAIRNEAHAILSHAHFKDVESMVKGILDRSNEALLRLEEARKP